MANQQEKNVPASIHDTDMRTLGAHIRTSIVFMLVAEITGDLENNIESAIRSVRRRWDDLCPPAALDKDRKNWSKAMVAKRSAWDAWFARFTQMRESVDSLNEQIVIVNSAERDGVEVTAKIKRIDVVDSLRAVGERLVKSSGLAVGRVTEQVANGSENGADGSEQVAKRGPARPLEKQEREEKFVANSNPNNIPPPPPPPVDE